ncbi:MAG: PEP-CTERM sorting domain-containing protein [Planctomycetota bacterium]
MTKTPADNPSKSASAKRKAAYSLAAGAATLAASGDQTANADIVYSGLQGISILPSIDPPFPDPYRLYLDLDSDSFTDVALQNAFFGGTPYQGASVFGSGGQLVGFNAGPSNYAYVSQLTEGDLIDPTTVGPTFFGSMAFSTLNPNAEFNSAPDAFLGLSFGTAPNLRYGWIRVGVENASASFVIKDWAYESDPGVGIRAGQIPEPGTLGLLAAGAAGLAAIRSRRSQS